MQLANNLRYAELPEKNEWAVLVRKASGVAGSVANLAQLLQCEARTIYRWQSGKYYPSRFYFESLQSYLSEEDDD